MRSICEAIMIDAMFELPSSNNISKVVVDQSVINGENDPILVYEEPQQDLVSGES